MSIVISSDRAPAALGPYSQAIKSGNLVFLSGQLGIDPATGTMVEGGVEAQATQALKNINAVLEAAGASFKNVVKTTVFLNTMNDFAAVNKIYAQSFTENPPARSCVAVAQLPLGALVEIECIVVLD